MKIKRSLVCAMLLGVLLPLATPASAIGSRPSAASNGESRTVTATAQSWNVASWFGRLLTAIWGREKGYIDPSAGASSSSTPLFSSIPIF